jgi:2-C-methyl-D-erythritol 4-phosphate cytidylyltransferase/2-C-methyl-D-erythritol 2,4-cyclodiphosphate synthase
MNPPAAAIIAAAGSGTRMQSSVPKQFLPLAGVPMLVHPVRTFARCACIGQVVVVVADERVGSTKQMLSEQSIGGAPITVVSGGRRRQDSVKNGLAALNDEIEIVLVHDGARPLVSKDLIERCYAEIRSSGAALAAIEVKDTLKQQGDEYRVQATLDRQGVWQAQTPQGARRELLEQAYLAANDNEVTDEATLLENVAIKVRLVPGEEQNFKITRQEDLLLAQAIMNQQAPSMRIGHGFDAHRYAENRKLVLGGVEIPYRCGLAGHSDADVVCHALCDAILGAAGSGDIGRHFPDSDEQFKDISSLLLLERVVMLAAGQGLALANADITIVCQAPKLAPYMQQMLTRLARHCQVEAERLNIKATTTEKMGYTGREEGISCHAVVLMENKKR